MSTWEPEQPELEVPLTKRQLKHRRNKDSKAAKKFKNLEKKYDTEFEIPNGRAGR